MSWSNWVYLGVGLGIGVGANWLFKKIRGQEGSREITREEEDNQNVTALLAQLKQTQVAYQLAQEMSLFKAGFLARTTHELRSPLNSLIGLHQLILSDLCDDPAEEREFVFQAHEAALKLIRLIDEILEVARTEHGTNKLEIQPLQLATVLQQVYKLTHTMAANRNFRLQLLPPDPDIYVLADPRWLRQVLLNLLDASIAQMEEGSILISAQPTVATESVQIWLDVPLPASAWSEPIDLMQFEHSNQEQGYKNTALSLGMKLLQNQTLLELMQGRLEILPVPTDTNAFNLTRIQVTIPLLIPETAFEGTGRESGNG